MRKVRNSEVERHELRTRVEKQNEETKALKQELDALKRRLDRQETDYVQTMRQNA